MARRRFFVDHIHRGEAEISGDEAEHLRKVLRAEVGQRYEISDNEQAYLAEIAGFGSTADAFRVTDIHEDGRGGIAAMRLALEDAGVKPQAIGYISAHGTGTEENDKIESWYNGTQAIGLAIQRQPGTNTVEVVDLVRKLIPNFRAEIPASINLNILYDRSVSIRDSVITPQ